VEGKGGGVAGSGGVTLVVEQADGSPVAVILDARVPLSLSLGPADAAELRGAALLRTLVVRVLLRRARAQVAFDVVQAIVVDVIDHQAGGGIHNHVVYAELAFALAAHGVEAVALLGGAPFVPGELGVVLRVHEGELVLCQGDLAVRVADEQPVA
jgi:hypothetical protein